MTAWVTPRTWVAGETITSSRLNVHVRDNLNVLYEDIPRLPWDNPCLLLNPLSSGSTVGTNNNCHYQRLYGGAVNTSIRKVRMHINASSGTVSVAIYSSTGSGITCLPGSRVATTGSVAAPAGGQATIDLGSTVTDVGQGTHWLALSASTTAFTFVSAAQQTTVYQGGLAAAQTAAHPAPSSASPTATTSIMPQINTLPA